MATNSWCDGFVLISFLSHCTGEKHAVFQVHVFDGTPNNPVPCSEVKFIYQSSTDDNAPLFIVYSYDYQINELNYKEIEDRLASEAMTASTAQPSTSQAERRKRSSSEPPTDPPSCEVQELIVESKRILPHMRRNKHNEQLVVAKPSTYNAGICGGLCTSGLPMHTHHSTLISLLLNEQSFEHGYKVTKNCSPVKYRDFHVMGHNIDLPGTSYVIFIIPNMIIDKCECIDIVDYS